MTIFGDEIYGYWYKGLAEGCRLCMEGLKVVIFVTGLCNYTCFYCPLSYDRRKADAFYVDEERVDSLEIILDEVTAVGAKGASITGGEPLQRIDLVLEIVRMLKSVFGSSFHIHLYTSGLYASPNVFKELDRAGLDEIRFHPVDSSVWKVVEWVVKETSMCVGIEIPALPLEPLLKAVVLEAQKRGALFVNLNELEASETNIDALLARGYRVDLEGRRVPRSLEVAKRVVWWANHMGLEVSVHLCPSRFKELVQMRYRLRRKGARCLSIGEILEEDGAIRSGESLEIPLLSWCAPLLARAKRLAEGDRVGG